MSSGHDIKGGTMDKVFQALREQKEAPRFFKFQDLVRTHTTKKAK